VGLMHYPIFNRNKEIVATTITHFDVHDIARICRSYGVKKYHLIHPALEQLMFVSRLKEHWSLGLGKDFNPLRAEAMKIVETAESLTSLKDDQGFYKVYATSAKDHLEFPRIGFSGLIEELKELKHNSVHQTVKNEAHRDSIPHLDSNSIATKKILIIFGTGSGLVKSVFEDCDALIEPIVGFEGSDFSSNSS
jgi:hypothetical protein